MSTSLPALACVGLANGLPNSTGDRQSVPTTELAGPQYSVSRQEQNVYIFGWIHISPVLDMGPCCLLQAGIYYEEGRSLLFNIRM